MRGLGGIQDKYDVVKLPDSGGGSSAAASFGIFIASIALIIIGFAFWQISFYLGIGAMAFGVGGGFSLAARGASYIIHARAQGRAAIIAAEGEAMARLAEATAKATDAKARLIRARGNEHLLGDGR